MGVIESLKHLKTFVKQEVVKTKAAQRNKYFFFLWIFFENRSFIHLFL